MPGEDMITMAGYELRRMHLIKEAIEKVITQKEAASMIGLSLRQVQRVVARFRSEGERGIIHKSRGRESNRAIAKRTRQKILGLYRSKYPDFGPTLAAEKLFERDGIEISEETLRLWLLAEGVPYGRRRPRAHRKWRERKAYFGQMVQMDGSDHDWFEGRGPECALMGYIDDATGNIYGQFYEYEGTTSALDSLRGYVLMYGVPASIYLDKHSTYRVNRSATIEEQLRGEESLSQFERAAKELGVEIIHADSPQAKGRIERSFKTAQDRLVKEMRLAGVSTIAQANQFLKHYVPTHNRRFRVVAAKAGDLHRPRPSRRELDRILCVHTERVVRNDTTVMHGGNLYQILERPQAKKVLIEERLSGQLVFRCAGEVVSFKKLTPRPRQQELMACSRQRAHTGHAPASTHLWRQYQNNKPPAPQQGAELVGTNI